MPPAGDIDHRSLRHWGGFIFSGGTAFLVDLGATEVLHHLVGIDRMWSRFIAIVIATVVAWVLHRRISFNVPYPPSLAEFTKFFVSASLANASTFLVYWALLRAVPHTPLAIAVFLSSGVGGALSYVLFRFGVFRRPEDAFERHDAARSAPLPPPLS